MESKENTLVFILISQHEDAFNLIIDFVNNKDKRVFILKDYTSTDKPTFMSGRVCTPNKRTVF